MKRSDRRLRMIAFAVAILALVLGVVFRTLSTGLSHERTAGLVTARVLEARSILRVRQIEFSNAATLEKCKPRSEQWRHCLFRCCS